MKIYIASSWRNQHAVELLTQRLREQDHAVTSWVEYSYSADSGPKGDDFEAWVRTDGADRIFDFATRAAQTCDLFIYLSPGGKDAAAECGIAFASRRPMWALWAKGEDLGVMRKMFGRCFDRVEDLLDHTSDAALKGYALHRGQLHV